MDSLNNKINTSIKSLNFETLQPSELYAPVDYILSLGGKRIRPILVTMACKLFCGDGSKAIPQAAAIELFHNFTLIHDDIMDEAPTRRSKPTIHTKWDLNTGILSGDVLMMKAYERLADCDSKYLAEVLRVFNSTGILVCEGQQLDINFETRLDVTTDEYIEMITLKTAVLLEGSLKVGAIIGDGSKDNIKLLGQFGVNLGIAFQLQDDILDAYGDPDKFGKQVGGDIFANKKTILLITALNSKTTNKDELLSLLELKDGSKVEKILEFYKKSNAKQIAINLRDQYFSKAINFLTQVEGSDQDKQFFIDMANKLQVREV